MILPDEYASSGTPPPAPTEEKPFPCPGYRWKTCYLVQELLADNTGTQVWDALNVDTMSAVRLCVARVLGPARAEAVRRIKALNPPGIHFPIGSALAEAAELDIYNLPPGPSLRAWRLGRQQVSAGFVHSLVKALSSLLSQLHAQGVGHFNLRMENITVEGDEEDPRFFLGGWDCATLFDQKDLISIPVDPFMAPPEAAGLHKHSPGPDLACWDWWSLGRVIQELILGHPVLATLLGRDISGSLAEMRGQAEELLQGRLGNHKPGAVESMPSQQGRNILLLQGLLSAGRDSRWRETECGLWLSGETPREHYLSSGREPCLRWEGQAYTIAEMADTLRGENKWEHAADQLLQPELPNTLAWFVHKYAPDAVCRKLKEATGLLEDEDLQEFPPAALREIVTMVSLLQLAGGSLIWRGRRIDGASIRDNLRREDGSGQWLGSVWALTSSPILCLLDKLDPEAGRVLTDLGRLAGKVVERALANGWLSQTDLAAISRLWELSCEHPATLHKLIDELRSAYACSLSTEVEDIFRAGRPSTEDSVLLAYMAGDPRRFSFLTHAEWARREYQRIHEKGMCSTRLLLWMNLRRALRLGPWWYGRVWWLILGWGALAIVFSAARPGPLMALVALSPLLVAFAVRWLLVRQLKPLLSSWIPDAAPWRFRDKASRCQKEIAAFGLGFRSRAQLRGECAEANLAITKLKALNPPPAAIPAPPGFLLLCLASLSSWLIFLLLFTLSGWQLRLHPPSWESFRTAWGLDRSKAITDPNDPRLVKMPWPFKQPQDLKIVKAKAYRTATKGDINAALARGKAQVSEYIPETISALTLVRIPNETSFGFMFYDGRRHQVASKQVIILIYNPLPRNWIEIDGKAAFILPQ